jgi:protein phosphatase PTC7
MPLALGLLRPLLRSSASTTAFAAAIAFGSPRVVFGLQTSSFVRCASSSSADEKNKEDKQPAHPLVFVAEGTMFPSPDKPKGDSGEDAFFINKRSLGVFDGVGGWRDMLKDAGEYSRTLATMASHYCTTIDKEQPGKEVDPLHATLYALYNTRVMGSSTSMIATIGQDGMLRVRNVGDSGLMLWRRHMPKSLVPQRKDLEFEKKLWELEVKTKVGQYSFNFPHQLEFSDDTSDPRDGEALNIKPKQGDLGKLRRNPANSHGDGIFFPPTFVRFSSFCSHCLHRRRSRQPL